MPATDVEHKLTLICVRREGLLMLKPRRKPPKAYPNADRFGEDGRRLYAPTTQWPLDPLGKSGSNA